jgi:hypothetical protein
VRDNDLELSDVEELDALDDLLGTGDDLHESDLERSFSDSEELSDPDGVSVCFLLESLLALLSVSEVS